MEAEAHVLGLFHNSSFSGSGESRGPGSLATGHSVTLYVGFDYVTAYIHQIEEPMVLSEIEDHCIEGHMKLPVNVLISTRA